MKTLFLGVCSRAEIDGAFAAILETRPDALLGLADRPFLHHRQPMMDFARAHRLPGVRAYRELVIDLETGCMPELVISPPLLARVDQVIE